MTTLTPDTRGWQPIETAPKDGTKVLLGRFTGNRKADQEGRIRVDWWRDYRSFGEFNTVQWPATHWMSLPAPPESPAIERAEAGR